LALAKEGGGSFTYRRLIGLAVEGDVVQVAGQVRRVVDGRLLRILRDAGVDWIWIDRGSDNYNKRGEVRGGLRSAFPMIALSIETRAHTHRGVNGRRLLVERVKDRLDFYVLLVHLGGCRRIAGSLCVGLDWVEEESVGQ